MTGLHPYAFGDALLLDAAANSTKPMAHDNGIKDILAYIYQSIASKQHQSQSEVSDRPSYHVEGRSLSLFM